MIIHEPEVLHQNGEVVLQVRVESRSTNPLPETLWFRYPERYAQHLSLRADPFLGTLAQVASSLDEDLECRGEVSPRLLYNLTEYLSIFNRWRPDVFQPIQIHAPQVTRVQATHTEPCYASAFSGGVDSFYTLRQTLYQQDGHPTWPVKYLLFMHGSPDIPLVYADKYEKYKAQYGELCSNLGIDLIAARTNALQFSSPTILLNSFLEAPLFGAALALSLLLSGVIIPGGRAYFNYRETAAGPITTHLLSTEGFESFDFSTAISRLEKTQSIVDWEPVQRHLRVCLGYTQPGDETNCSNCWKCVRTRMDLHLLGELKSIQTLDTAFTLKDYLGWGRWMAIGSGWELDVLRYAWKHRKHLLLLLLPMYALGYVRHLLKKYLPRRVLRHIFNRVGDVNPYPLFMQKDETVEPRQEASI